MRTNPLAPFLARQHFVVLDGGLATELERQGARLDDPLWSARLLIEAPERIRQVHHGFLEAGADVIATASYQASFEGFRQAGYDERQAEDLLRLSVDLAVLARETFWSGPGSHLGRLRPLVAASIGPYGAFLHDGSEYHGDYGIGKRELKNFHRQRIAVLSDSGADLLAFETIPSQQEAEVLLELLDEFPGVPAWLSFSCRDGESVSHGEPFSACAAIADAHPQIVAVGVNCTAPEHISTLLNSVAGLATPRIVYPNSGERWDAAMQHWAGGKCAAMPVAEWYTKGAHLIGGCCRTTVEDVSAVRAELVRAAALSRSMEKQGVR